MTCAAVGDLGEVSRRVQALAAWWRPESSESIRKALAEAAALPARQAEAMDSHRAAADVLAQLEPDGHQTTQECWREEQAEVTRTRSVLVALRAEEAALLSLLEVEVWWARKRAWAAGVAALDAQERAAAG